MARKFGNLISNESAGIGAEGALEGGADAPETDLLTAAVADEAGNEYADGADATVEVEQNIQDKLEQAEASVADGGDGMAPEVLEAVAEGLTWSMNTIAMRIERSKIPTVEGLRQTRKSNLQATLEFIDTMKDKAKQAWDWIVKAFKDIKKWFKDFFAGLFDATKKYKIRAEKIRKQAEQAVKDGKTTKASEEDDKVSTSSFFEALRVNGAIQEKQTANSVTGYFKMVETGLDGLSVHIKKFGEEVVGIVEATEKSSAGFGERAKELGSSATALVDITGFSEYRGTEIDIPELCVAHSMKIALGDKAVFAVIPKHEIVMFKNADGRDEGKIKASFDDLGAALGRMKVIIGKGAGYKEAATQDKVYGMPLPDVVTVAKAVEDQMAKFGGYEKEAKAFEAQADKMATKCGTLFKKIEGDNGKTMRDQARFAGKASHAMINLMNGFIKSFRKNSVNVAAGALNYCQLTLGKIE